MSYKTTIPNPTDFLAISQKQLLANYQAIFNTFSKNHVSLITTQNNPGNHTSFTMTRQTMDPTTGATQVSLYNKYDANTVPQLFYRPNNSQTSIQMTNGNSSLLTDATQYRQSTFLPGPFTLYVGYIRDVVHLTVVTLLPSTTLNYVGVIALGGAANNAVASSISANQFTVKLAGNAPAKTTIYYMAIGLS